MKDAKQDKGSDELNLKGDTSIYGSIYAKEGKIKLQGSSRIHGNIFSSGNEIELQGGTHANAQLIFAPNAKVRLNGSGTVNGKIISNKFELQGGGTVNFDEPYIIEGPISIEALQNQGTSEGGAGNGNDSGNSQTKPTFSTSPVKEIEDK